MTESSFPAPRFVESDFRIGRAFNRTAMIFSRNFLPFCLVTAVASLPDLALKSSARGVGLFLPIILNALSQAIVLYGAFQEMRGRPVSLAECLKVGLRRFLPIVGLAILTALGIAFGFVLLVVPGLILFTMWFVATPACVVEQLGPFRSMERSAQLTKGHRWKILGAMLLLLVPAVIVSQLLEVTLTALGGSTLALAGDLTWTSVWGAFYAVLVVVTYHDLRVVKDGVDIEQIAAVFD
jgi:hypothetical protein